MIFDVIAHIHLLMLQSDSLKKHSISVTNYKRPKQSKLRAFPSEVAAKKLRDGSEIADY